MDEETKDAITIWGGAAVTVVCAAATLWWYKKTSKKLEKMQMLTALAHADVEWVQANWQNYTFDELLEHIKERQRFNRIAMSA